MLQWVHRNHRRSAEVEREKSARLEDAEREVADLRSRADRAIRTLDDRHTRNHWRESIEQMIQGAAK
jgi:hypothetical protein